MPNWPRLALFGAGSALLLACNKDAADKATTSSAAPPPHPTATAAPVPATATATATATAVATGAPAAGGTCSLVGEWKGLYPPGPYPFSGTPFDFSIKADGSGMTHSQRADSEFAWKAEGGAFALHGVKTVKGGRFSCAKEEVGKYGFTFAQGCAKVTMKLREDACRGRSLTMDGITIERK